MPSKTPLQNTKTCPKHSKQKPQYNHTHILKETGMAEGVFKGRLAQKIKKRSVFQHQK